MMGSKVEGFTVQGKKYQFVLGPGHDALAGLTTSSSRELFKILNWNQLIGISKWLTKKERKIRKI